MRNIALMTFLALILLVTPAARAGSAGTGQMTTVTVGGHLSAQARKLVGTWRMSAITIGGRRRPLPSGFGVVITFHSSGRAEAMMHRRGPAPRKTVGTWKVKGNRLIFKARPGAKGPPSAVQNTRFQLKGKELILSLGSPRKHILTRLILTRVSRKP